MSVFPVDVTTLRENPGQAVFLGLEIGLPYNLAYTLSNPLGQALSAVSVVTLAVFFFMNMLWLSYLASSDVPQGRRKRSTNNTSPPLFDLEDGVWFLPKDSLPCRQRVVCDVHALLADSPVVVQTGVRFITRRLELGQFKEAARQGLSGAKCENVYSECRKCNMQIVSQIFSNLGLNIKTGRRGGGRS